MKKLLSFLFVIGLCLLGLFGCENSKVTYKDPDTGEEKELKIEKTENETEVADSLYAVALSETPVKETAAASAKLTFNVDLAGKDNGGDQKLKAKGSLEINETFDKDAKIETYMDLVKAYALSAKLELSGEFMIDGGDLQKVKTSTVELFLEDGVLYAKINLDAKLAEFISSQDEEVGAMVQLVNEKTLKLDLSTVLPADEKLDDDAKEALEALQGGKKLKELLEEEKVDLKALRAQIEEIVKEYGIKITKVKGGEVTYSADLGKEAFGETSESKLEVSVTVNVAEISLAGLSVKADIKEGENVNGTAEATLEVSYKAKVAKISDSDKEKAVDASTLMGGDE